MIHYDLPTNSSLNQDLEDALRWCLYESSFFWDAHRKFLCEGVKIL